MLELNRSNAVQVLPKRTTALVRVKKGPQRLIRRDVDQKNFQKFIMDLSKVPYLRVEGRVGLKKDFEFLENKVNVEANLGANIALEYKGAKIEVEHAFAGVRARGHVKPDAKDSSIGPDEHKIEKYRGGSFEYSLELLDKADSKAIEKKSALNINGKQYIDKKETLYQAKKDGDDGSNVQLVGDPYSVNVCHVVNIKARKGYDKTELEKVKEFYKENAESINRGLANEAKKHAGELHQKTGKALKDYIDMPYVID